MGLAVLWLLLAALMIGIGFLGAAVLRETDSVEALRPEDGQLIATEQGALHVLDLGPQDGPVLLFLHGAGAWAGLWRPVLQDMAAAGYRAIALDTPPFGFSERDPAGDYSRTRQAERILALLKALDIRPVLVGHSFGAGPGVEAVMRAPERFAGLIVVDGALGIGSQASELPVPLRPQVLREAAVSMTATNPLLTRRLLLSLIHVEAAATDEVVAVLQLPMRLSGSTAAFAAWLPALLRPGVDARSTRAESYRALCLPTMFIWGEQDTVTPLDQGRQAAALVSGAELIALPGVGHIPQIEAPKAFQDALTAALGKLRDAQSTCG
ncbi:alpha/beta hydrolase [uncultured Paracoccus sp.]|uniref:alpha/beta fold hydrolase n=1 Tax=uncultured Paracoccus sp. TaxID=189685 RepID=UPI0015EEA940|nr:alpha/beta hydrolase [uncultured Paracoccus sp.]MBA4490781.1 alpha/beta hydrolase [Paracoccus sp. S1E-3]